MAAQPVDRAVGQPNPSRQTIRKLGILGSDHTQGGRTCVDDEHELDGSFAESSGLLVRSVEGVRSAPGHDVQFTNHRR